MRVAKLETTIRGHFNQQAASFSRPSEHFVARLRDTKSKYFEGDVGRVSSRVCGDKTKYFKGQLWIFHGKNGLLVFFFYNSNNFKIHFCHFINISASA